MKTKRMLLSILLFIMPFISQAQCAMCRAVLESEADGAAAEGINNGILYLMAIPYILVGLLFYYVFKRIKN